MLKKFLEDGIHVWDVWDYGCAQYILTSNFMWDTSKLKQVLKGSYECGEILLLITIGEK